LESITTDHGHLAEGGHGGNEDVVRSSFFVVARCVGGDPDCSGDGARLPAVMRPEHIADYLLAHLAESA